MQPDGEGNTCAAVVNDKLGLGFYLIYSMPSLPY
jgi:hypothetical protein